MLCSRRGWSSFNSLEFQVFEKGVRRPVAVFYEEVLQALADAEVDFVVVGGLAVILHGVPRTTADLDVVLDLDHDNVLRFVEVLVRLGFRPRAPVDPKALADADQRKSWVQEKNLKAFTMTRGGIEDVVVLLETPLEHVALARGSETLNSEGVTIRVASIDDLITMKLQAGRDQDQADVEALRRLKELGDE